MEIGISERSFQIEAFIFILTLHFICYISITVVAINIFVL